MIKYDMHIHFDFFKSEKHILKYYNDRKIFAIYATLSPSVFLKYKSKGVESDYVKLALGAHPCYTNEYRFDYHEFDSALEETRYISEVGLDFSKKYIDSQNEQIKIFDYICSKTYNKLLIIHSRNAEEEIYEMLVRNRNKYMVLHWYTGPVSTLKKLVLLGAYVSINRKMLYTKKIDMYLSSVPIDRLLIETDAPFTLESNNIIEFDLAYDEIVLYLCKYYNSESDLIKRKLSENFYNLIVSVKKSNSPHDNEKN